ncbi:hypothetical protein M409DRAFT_70039 [Zasmidium cellare ATCC 36951]|uniref:Uncharacterized protein n=1 Tax=Zasmidium cellare ATCC 36951 TaxID=1080233 RepID=A0A6A6C225_ZASCE|nr:uncharacterized protein M409DRAFT_70039 [Zasmidium cellare ATCC 36951]KAF2160953.1 hypothetical protein M409DRAFT_70039 [Zasmidium cellare ATCC 36951]
MEYDPTYNGAVDWNFPSPTATPTSASFNHNHFQTPKTATLPSQFFQDAFSTPQMPGYATPRQPEYPSMASMQRAQQTSSDTLRNNYYANVQSGGPIAGQVMPPPSQAGYQAPVVSPIYGYSQALPPQPGQPMAFDSSHMQTPPPTRGTSVKKPTPGQPIAFGTPSTIASRRFVTPQQVNTAQPQMQGMPNNHMQFPHLQFLPDVYQFGNLGPASAPVFPQTQLLWEHTASPHVYNQQSMLDDPFAPATTGAMGWPAMPIQQNNGQPVAFDTPVMSSFPVQAPMQRPASAAPMANNQTPQPPPVSTATGVDPSLVYSSPVRPVLQSVPRQVKARNNASKTAAARKDSANVDHQRSETATSADAIITPVSKSELRRSNTTGTARPSSAHPTVGGESLARSNAVLQPPRTASPLKRAGKASLGSISETKKPKPQSRASVILTVDENGRARTQTTQAEDDSPEKAMRERYPGLFDSDSSDDESEEEEQTPSRSASFSFAKGEERKSKAAKLDPPVENLEGLTLPRSSSAASMKVTPSRAAIAAAAQLRRGGSLRKQTPSRNGQRRAASNAASSIDTAPMDVPSDRRQSMVNVDDSQMDWAGSTLNEHNRRWSMMSQQSSAIIISNRLNQKDSNRHHRHHHHHNRSPPHEYRDLSKTDIELMAPILDALPDPDASNASTYRQVTKQMISDLPSHLRAKVPQVSTFCSLHHKLNPMPLIDLLQAVQKELTPSSLRTWDGVEDLPFTTLQDVNAIWTKPDDFRKLFNRSPSIRFSYEDHKCAACRLACIARNPEAMIALGAIMIARLDPRNWKKSKRILWFEVSLKGCIQWRQEELSAVEVMWKTGVALTTGSAPSSTKEMGETAAVRPPRSPGQDDHVAFVAEALQDVEDPFIDPATTPTATPHNPFDDPYDEQAMDTLFPDDSQQQPYTRRCAIPEPLRTRSRQTGSSAYSHETARLLRTPATTNFDPRVASSIYSRRPDDEDEDEAFWASARFSGSSPSENEVIEAYRGSSRINGSRASGREFL